MKVVFLVSSLLVLWSHSCDASKLVCFFNNEGVWRTGNARFTVDNIDPNLCTHMIYGSANIEAKTYSVKIKDTTVDMELKGYEKLIALKKKNPKLKVMISVEGWDDSNNETNKYSELVANITNIETFVNSAVAFLIKYKFDGMGFGWMDLSEGDAIGYNNLIAALGKSLRHHGYLFCASGDRFKEYIDRGFNFSLLNENLDFLNVWTSEFYISNSEPHNADHSAPLRKRPWDTTDYYADFVISYWISKGISPSKIVMAIPLSGQSWTITLNTTNTDPPLLAAGEGAPGKIIQTNGSMAYSDICYAVRFDGWKVVHDPNRDMGPYAVSPTYPRTWVGYDDPDMAAIKSEYILSKGLGGAVVWDIGLDDFRDNCGDGANPILTQISKTLNIFVMPGRMTKNFVGNNITREYNSTAADAVGYCDCICN